MLESKHQALEAFSVQSRSRQPGATHVRSRLPARAALTVASSMRRTCSGLLELIPVVAMTLLLWWWDLGGVSRLAPTDIAFLPEHIADVYNTTPTTLLRPLLAPMVAVLLWSLLPLAVFGKNPVKAWLGMRVVDSRGDAPQPLTHVLRAVGCVLSVATLGLGWLLALVLPSRRTLHDILSGTYVVR